jgi:hypothetical protein
MSATEGAAAASASARGGVSRARQVRWPSAGCRAIMNAAHLLSMSSEELSESRGDTDAAAAASVWVEGDPPEADARVRGGLPQSGLLRVSRAVCFERIGTLC